MRGVGVGHSIRLREPWQRQPVLSPASLGAARGDEQLLEFSRSFNAPSGLSAQQTLEIHIALRPEVRLLAASLNGHLLAGEPGPAAGPTAAGLRFEIRSCLRPANQLQLTLGFPPLAVPLPHTLSSLADVVLLLGED